MCLAGECFAKMIVADTPETECNMDLASAEDATVGLGQQNPVISKGEAMRSAQCAFLGAANSRCIIRIVGLRCMGYV
jgi:hypothetical protein